MDTKEYWDELADRYQVTDGTTDWLCGYPQVIDFMGDVNGKCVVDYGCGFGHFTRYVAQTFPLAHVIGIDTSPRAVKNARLKTDESLGLEFHHISGHQDISNFAPDVVCTNFVFCTIPNLDTMVDILRTIHSALRPGGRLIIMEPHPLTHGVHFTSFQSDSPEGKESGDSIHVRLFTNSIDVEFDDYYWKLSDYDAALTQAGFHIYETSAPTAQQYTHASLRSERQFPPFIIYRATK